MSYGLVSLDCKTMTRIYTFRRDDQVVHFEVADELARDIGDARMLAQLRWQAGRRLISFADHAEVEIVP